jgi:formamidopyrimidine-DNA glycosylase
MPELPEVETIVRQLAGSIPGRRIRAVSVFRDDLLREPEDAFRAGLRGRIIESVTRRGKNILLNLPEGHRLLVNLGMTGQLLFREEASREDAPPHLAIRFSFHEGGDLLYVDVRRFGHLIRYSPTEWKQETRRLGPEPLGPELTGPGLHASLQRSRAPIRSWLLDQTKVAGIGNIYAAEALFRAGIHPKRRALSLDLQESKALFKGIREVLEEAVRAQGTTLRDYRTASGDRGGFGPALLIYGREGEGCVSCKAMVERIVFGNRSAFFCPHCQPETLCEIE